MGNYWLDRDNRENQIARIRKMLEEKLSGYIGDPMTPEKMEEMAKSASAVLRDIRPKFYVSNVLCEGDKIIGTLNLIIPDHI